jgi:hypothetical protein
MHGSNTRSYALIFAKPTKQSDVMVIYAIRRLDSCATTCSGQQIFSALTFCVSTSDVSLGITASLECCCLYIGQEEKKEKDLFFLF